MPSNIENGSLKSWEIKDETHLGDALFYGLLPTESLTGQVISKLGEYRRTVLKRKYYQGVKSKREAQKLLILDYAQNAIKGLQDVERKINCDENVKVSFNPEKINSESCLTLASAIDNLQDEQKQLIHDKALNAHEIQDFVRNETIRIIQNAKALNQFITYDIGEFAMTRGKLDEYCEDALKMARDYQFDLNKKIQKEHQGVFEDRSSSEGVQGEASNTGYILPLEHLNDNREAIEEIIMALMEIEAPNQSTEVQKTAIPQWSSTLPLWQRILNQGIAFFNIIGLTFLNTEINYYHANDESSVWKEINLIQIKPKNIFEKMGVYLASLGNATVIDFFKGIFLLLAYPLLIVSWHFSNFFNLGELKAEKSQNAEKYLDSLLGEGEVSNQNTGSNQSKASVKSEPEKSFGEKKVLQLPYHLSSFNQQANDPLSFAVKTATQTLGHITHHMYEQNSFLGAVFTVTGVVGGLSILAPQVLHSIFQTSLVAKPFVATGNALGGMDVSMQAMSAIMMPSKGAALAVDFLSNGPGSFLGSLIERLGNNPSDLMLFVVLALGLGWGIPMAETGMTLEQTVAMMPVPMMGIPIMKGLIELMHSQKNDKNAMVSDLSKENKNNLQLVLKIIKNQGQLASRSYFERRKLYQKICEENNNDNDSLLRDFAYKTLLMPKASGIFTSTAVILLNHFIFPAEQLMVDLAIVLNAIALVTHTVTNLARAIVCGFADVVWNNGVMRLHGAFNCNKEFSTIHKISAQSATALDCAKTSADSKFGFFTNLARREATQNTPATYAASFV